LKPWLSADHLGAGAERGARRRRCIVPCAARTDKGAAARPLRLSGHLNRWLYGGAYGLGLGHGVLVHLSETIEQSALEELGGVLSNTL